MEISFSSQSLFDLKVEAIFNPVNSSWLSGKGISSQIHKNAGPWLAEECSQKGFFMNAGSSIITLGYRLKARYVIHGIGPFFTMDPENYLIIFEQCMKKTFILAQAHGIKNIAIPFDSLTIVGHESTSHLQLKYLTILKSLDSFFDGKVILSTLRFVETEGEKETTTDNNADGQDSWF